MRDFKAGGDINVGGDVYIHDESVQHKLLIHCTNEELRAERTHRIQVLSGERKHKWKRVGVAWLIVGGGLALTAIWLYLTGKEGLSSLVLGLGGVMLAFATIKVIDEPTEFERRQLAALTEISYLLRERGAE